MANLTTTCAAALLFATTALAQFPYGAGTAGSGGFTPRLRCNQPWAGRGSFTFEVEQGFGGAPGFVALGLLPGSASFGGLPLHLDPTAVMTLLPVVLGGSGAGQGATAVPLSLAGVPPAFIGVDFYAQAAFADLQGPGLGGGWTATAGLEVEVTATPQLFLRGGPSYLALNGLTQTVDFTGPNTPHTADAFAAAYSNDGLDLYVLSTPSNPGTVQLAHADLRTGAPAWSSINTTVGTGTVLGRCEFDRARRLLWTVGGPSTAPELWAIDVDPTNPSYGQIVGNTGSLAASFPSPFAYWAMSPDRTLAALVPDIAFDPSLGSANDLVIVDTAPGSPTFLQVLGATPLPVAAGLSRCSDIEFSADGDECYVAMFDELARFDVASGTWVDHDPATPVVDNLGPSSIPPIAFGPLLQFDVAPDGAIWLAGWDLFTGGWAGRLTIAGLTPTLTPISGTPYWQGTGDIGVNRDGTTVAFLAGNIGQVLLIDTATLNPQAVLSTGYYMPFLAWR